MNPTQKNRDVDSLLYSRTRGADTVEHLTLTPTTQLDAIYVDNILEKDNILDNVESKITSNKLSVQELTNNTEETYRIIYVIFITILVLVLLGVFTYIKNILSMSDKIYMTFVAFILVSYLFYIMYLYNWMYAKDSINKLNNYIKYGKFDVDINIDLKMPLSMYVANECKKRNALKNAKIVSEDEDIEEESRFIKSSDFRKKLPDNRDVGFYNDGDAPKLLAYPMDPDTLSPKPNKDYGKIYYTDYDSVIRGSDGELVQTIQL